MSFSSQAPAKSRTDIIAAHIKEKRAQEAAPLVEALLKDEPQNAVAWHLKSWVEYYNGNVAEAIVSLNTALQYDPVFKEACADLGRMLEAAGHSQLAVKAYEHLIKIELMQPARTPKVVVNESGAKSAKKWFQEGRLLQAKGDSLGAVTAFRKVLKLYPAMPEALTNLGVVLSSLRRYTEAQEALLTCLRIKPDYTPALVTLGTCYKDTAQNGKAIAAYRLTLAADPKHVPAAVNIGRTYFEKNFEEAIKAYEYALTIDPECVEALCELTFLSYRMCKWDKAEEGRRRMQQWIAEERRPMGPFTVATMVPSPQLQLKNARRYSIGAYAAGKHYDPAFTLPADARGDGKLRIGYLSADFQDHATARLISELFEQHDRSRFEIFAYSHGREDHVKEPRLRIRAAVDAFHDLHRMDDQNVVSLIKKDKVDLLIDLKGYTLDHRLSIMAERPAPIAMHYLGFPGTTGAVFIDYFLTDHVTSPKGADSFFAEQLIRLPHSYQINDRKRPLPTRALSREAYGLPAQGFVFCDFNNAYKITRDVFAVWMRLLQAVAGSVLWLSEADAGATANLRQEAQAYGVDAARLIVAKTAPQEEHLQRYRHADLFLDTSPVCGHTTSSDALWCGVPVITLAGESFVSRVAAGLLHAVGLPDLVAGDLAAYEALALALACDKTRLQQLRQHLENGRMRFALFDATATARALEAAYSQAAELHRQGIAPKAFSV